VRVKGKPSFPFIVHLYCRRHYPLVASSPSLFTAATTLAASPYFLCCRRRRRRP
jgi:hypothetical protein